MSARQARDLVEWLLGELGVAAADFDADPFVVLAPLEAYAGRSGRGGTRLGTAVAMCLGEILVQAYGGRWVAEENKDDPAASELVVWVDGRDGRPRSVNPARIMR